MPRHRARTAILPGLLLSISIAAWGQGGPPMVTDDPDTPGDGKWEINLGNIGGRSFDGWTIAALDADINYGWGERIQLKIDTPWNLVENTGDWTNGLGTSLLGVKWRFFDDDAVGWTISTYPQIGVNLDSASIDRGAAAPGKSVLLPFEAATHWGPLDLDFEVGRSLVQSNADLQIVDEWIAGVIVAHAFTPQWECMFETRERKSDVGSTTLLNLGSHWELTKGLALLSAVGREFGSDRMARADLQYYIGVQILR
jgi:hypothetical protein